MDANLIGIIIFFTAINLIAFLIMLFDKIQSSKGSAERISEGLMFFMAAAFGSIGVYTGMHIFRHKTKKWYFIIGIPLVIIQNIAFLYLAYLFLSNKLIFNIK